MQRSDGTTPSDNEGRVVSDIDESQDNASLRSAASESSQSSESSHSSQSSESSHSSQSSESSESSESFESSQSSESIASQHIPEPELPRSEWVYGVVKTAAISSLALEAFYEWFTYKYTAQALQTLADFAGDTYVTPYAIIPVTAALTCADALANVTLFDPNEEAEEWAKSLPNGFFAGTLKYLKTKFTVPAENGRLPAPVNGFVTFALPAVGMLISFPVGSYADVEPIQEWLKEKMGDYQFVPLTMVLALGTSYYVLSMGQDAISGMDFYLNQGKRRLDPPQATLAHHFLNGEYATVFQCVLEQLSATVSRSMSFAFLAGRVAEQQIPDASEATVGIAQAIGFTAAVLAFHPGRAPKSYGKYFGTAGNRLDLVTEAQRNEQYVAKYGNMSWGKFIAVEVKRLLHPLAIAEPGLASYLGIVVGHAINGLIQNQQLDGTDSHSNPTPSSTDNLPPEVWLTYLLPAIFAVIAGAAVYFGIYRRAELKRELNGLAVNAAREAQADQPQAQANEVVIGSTAKTIGALIAAGSWTARTLVSVPSTMSLKPLKANLKREEQIIVAVGTNVVPAMNGYIYFRDKCSSVVQGYGNSVTEFFNRRRQKRPSVVDERTSLLLEGGNVQQGPK